MTEVHIQLSNTIYDRGGVRILRSNESDIISSSRGMLRELFDFVHLLLLESERAWQLNPKLNQQ
jgi:hypothetical protein